MNLSFHKIFRDYQEIAVRYDEKHQAVWCYFNPAPRPCFSTVMLTELRQMQQAIMDFFETEKTKKEPRLRYLVVCSQVPGIFNLGGDLALFINLIKKREKKQLLEYAMKCIDTVYLNSVSMHLPMTTISLVEGTALGGGFETALSSNVLLATRDAEMGFPEIRFNLFPGMGAFNLIARLAGIAVANKLISGGKIYTGKELYALGLVNQLIESETPLESVERFIRKHRRSANGHRALQLVRQQYHPLEFQELVDATKIWVDAALCLTDKDLKMMGQLVKAQQTKVTPDKYETKRVIRTKQDRRIASHISSFPLANCLGKTILSERRHNPDRRHLKK